MIRLGDITNLLREHHPDADIQLVEKAYVYSAKVHQGQIRLSGEPYLSHPLEVAYILARMKMDAVCVAAALLHDAIEDTDAELSEITRLFGEETARIVDGITKISKINFESREERQAESIRKMILAMTSDIRVVLVKLADRLHNMSTLGFQPPDKQRIIAQETLDIYAPLAGRLGISWVKSRLEDLALYYLEPEIYQRINAEVAERKEEREKFIREIRNFLSEKLAEQGIEATIKGRQKHFYSIYNKMVDQNLSSKEVYDIVAFRIIVNSLKECYEALGIIHAMWKPVPGKFKDYISLPKENMYQSLHTTVMGSMGEKMEIQIRTHEMDRLAEEGIAAHWKYKEGSISSHTEEKQFAWLRKLLESQQNLRDPLEFLETVRMDLFPNEVYVFTPQGEVKEFPKGATPVDFAYSIHSEIGDRCSGAKVNGRMVPLRYQLQNGDVVEIITSPSQRPNKNWLEFVKTSRAKTKIRHWVKTQEREESIELGKRLLEKALVSERVKISSIKRSDEIAEVAKEMSFHSSEDLLAQIGFGKVSAKQVVGRVKRKLGVKEEGGGPGLVSKMVHTFKRRKGDLGIRVKGMSDVLVRIANCCKPLPGEPVIGFITMGRGITIHNRNCQHIANADPERLVEVSWEASSEDRYIAKLRVSSIDKKGILANISSTIAQKDANIVQAEVKMTTNRKGVSFFTVEIKNYEHLQQLMEAIRKLRNVLRVERL